MKSLVSTFVFSFFLLYSVNAQEPTQKEKIRFSAGLGIALPVGNDFGGLSKFGVGVLAQAVKEHNADFDFFAQTGIMHFSGDTYYWNNGANNTKFTRTELIPVVVGARYKKNNWFYGGGIGVAFVNGNGLGNGFLWTPQVGYDFKKVELFAEYSSTKSDKFTTLSYLGVKCYYKL